MDPSNCAYGALLKRYCTAALAATILWPTLVNAQTATQGNSLAPPLAPSSTVPQTISVPGGTTVLVALTEPISSATATVNDQVGVIVKKQVVVNGWIVVPAGANGHATCNAANRSKSGLRSLTAFCSAPMADLGTEP
jgi:hypothetical protein